MGPRSERSQVMRLMTCPRGFVFCINGRDCFPRRLTDGQRELLQKYFPNQATHSEANPNEVIND